MSRVAPPEASPALLRVLLVEDSEDDAILVLRALQSYGYEPYWLRVCDRAGIERALAEGMWDVAVSDFHLPSLDAMEVLEMVRDSALDLPFIVVSGKIGEEVAVDAMRAGAHDYVTKTNLARLGPAVERELREAAARRERVEVERKLHEEKLRYQTLAEHIPVVVYTQKVDHDTLEYLSPRLEEVLGYTLQEYLSDPGLWIETIHPEDRERVLAENGRIKETSESYSIEYRRITREGRVVWVRDEAALIRDQEGAPLFRQGVLVDITKQKQSEERLQRAEEKYRSIFENAVEGIFQTTTNLRLITANSAFAHMFGYDSLEQMLQSVSDAEHQACASPVLGEEVVGLLQKHGSVSDLAIERRRRDGSLRWFSISARTIEGKGGELAGFEGTIQDITQRRQAEQGIKRNLDLLLALRAAGQVLGSTLSSEEIGNRLLRIIRDVSNLTTAIIDMEDENGQLNIRHSIELDRLWPKARYAPEAEAARRAALAGGERRTYWLRRPGSEEEYFQGLCLPLQKRDRIIGVLEVYKAQDSIDSDTVDILDSLANQAVSALENARLYEELAEREKRLEELVGKLITAQEKERRKVAYEIHDGLAQISAAAHQHLQGFVQSHPPDSAEARQRLEQALGLVRESVGEARRVIAELRPTALDDFGLASALRLELGSLRQAGWQASYETNLEAGKRLPASVETELFRIAQEALTNIRKHADTKRVRLSLRRVKQTIRLRVRDWGGGFDPDASRRDSGSGERIGMSSMRERAHLLGGELEVWSSPGVGTLVVAKVPLSGRKRTQEERRNHEGALSWRNS